MKIGDMDIAGSLLQAEHDIRVLQQIMDYLIINNPNSLNFPSQSDFEGFKKKAVEYLQTKYPNMGIKEDGK